MPADKGGAEQIASGPQAHSHDSGRRQRRRQSQHQQNLQRRTGKELEIAVVTLLALLLLFGVLYVLLPRENRPGDEQPSSLLLSPISQVETPIV